MSIADLAGEDVILVRQLASDRQGLLRSSMDPVRAGMSTYLDFGAAALIQTIFVVATVLPLPTTSGTAGRCRITAVHMYNGNGSANNPTFKDGGAAAANRIWTTQTVAATPANSNIGPNAFPPGGLIVSTDFRVTPTQNNLEICVFYTGEIDFTYMM